MKRAQPATEIAADIAVPISPGTGRLALCLLKGDRDFGLELGQQKRISDIVYFDRLLEDGTTAHALAC